MKAYKYSHTYEFHKFVTKLNKQKFIKNHNVGSCIYPAFVNTSLLSYSISAMKRRSQYLIKILKLNKDIKKSTI